MNTKKKHLIWAEKSFQHATKSYPTDTICQVKLNFCNLILQNVIKVYGGYTVENLELISFASWSVNLLVIWEIKKKNSRRYKPEERDSAVYVWNDDVTRDTWRLAVFFLC